jgi:homospermidine synthase
MIKHPDEQYVSFEKKMLIVGFGAIGQAVLPLILRHIAIKPEQITIVTKNEEGKDVSEKYGISFHATPVTKDNYESILEKYLSPGDFLLNLSVDVSSIDLIKYTQKHDIIYLDTCIEPWAGVYVDTQLSAADRTNYIMREAALALRENNTAKKATAVLTHGANPGMVSHFVKQALMDLAMDLNLNVEEPTNRQEWAALAHRLNIKVIHIAEQDTQVTGQSKRSDEFLNTWSANGFISEGSQPAELGWGTHERHLPHDASEHTEGSRCAIYLNRPGASTRVRTWAPLAGAFHGFLITHSEAMSIADYFTVKKDDVALYRPTVHYAYQPCTKAQESLRELHENEWVEPPHKKVIFDEITDGTDELGVLLMGHEKGAYWYGSQLTVHEARELAPYNNATSLQVSSSVLAGIVWAMRHPEEGIVEPDEMHYKEVISFARPYLGKMEKSYTDWTPLKGREKLFPEEIDATDPWQFKNIRVE